MKQDASRQEILEEIRRMQDAISRSRSRHLQADYEKAIRRLQRKLRAMPVEKIGLF